jgi:hypothetical protein
MEFASSSNLMTTTITEAHYLVAPQTSGNFGAIRIMCCLGAWSSSNDLFWGLQDKEKYPEAVFHVLHHIMLVCILPFQFWFSPSLFGMCKIGVADRNKVYSQIERKRRRWMSFLYEKSAIWRWIVAASKASKAFYATFAGICLVVAWMMGYAVMSTTNRSQIERNEELRRRARDDSLVLWYSSSIPLVSVAHPWQHLLSTCSTEVWMFGKLGNVFYGCW